MERRGLIPERLTWSEVPGGRYELWSCPDFKPRYRVLFFVGGVQIGCHPETSEVRARAEFERRVEAKVAAVAA